LYKRSWFTICLRYNNNRFDAEDCLQTALVRIFSKLRQFDESKGSFKNWSNRIVVNANIAFLKRQRALNITDLDDDVLVYDDIQIDKENMISSENLIKVVQQLPVGYRSIFNLYVLEGFNHKEISDLLNISIGTSKSQLARAKKLLRNQLEELLKTTY